MPLAWCFRTFTWPLSTPSALCLWHGAFHIVQRLDSTHAGLPLDACDLPAATSNHSHPAFLLVVEDVFVSFPAGYGVHVFQHGFSVHNVPPALTKRHRIHAFYMHSPGSVVLWWLLLTGVSNFCALPSAQQPYQPRPVGLQLPRRLHQQRTWHSRRANNRLAPLKLHAGPQDDPVFSLCLPGTFLFTPCSRPQKHGYENVTKWSCTDVP